MNKKFGNQTFNEVNELIQKECSYNLDFYKWRVLDFPCFCYTNHFHWPAMSDNWLISNNCFAIPQFTEYSISDIRGWKFYSRTVS